MVKESIGASAHNKDNIKQTRHKGNKTWDSLSREQVHDDLKVMNFKRKVSQQRN